MIEQEIDFEMLLEVTHTFTKKSTSRFLHEAKNEERI